MAYKYLSIKDDVSQMNIVDIINNFFGKNYKMWMRACYHIDNEFMAWFPKITEVGDTPSGSWGGSKNYTNSLSEDGKVIIEVNHTETEPPTDEELEYDKLRFTFGRINKKFQFLGIYKRALVYGTEHLTYRYERVAVGARINGTSVDQLFVTLQAMEQR